MKTFMIMLLLTNRYTVNFTKKYESYASVIIPACKYLIIAPSHVILRLDARQLGAKVMKIFHFQSNNSLWCWHIIDNLTLPLS